MKNNEIWKDIPNYEGLYQVSNLGRVKSLARTIIKYNALTKRNNEMIIEERILIPSKNKYGYYRISLNKNNKRKTYPVHKLVADAFLENKDNLDTINHIDKNKLNNSLSNLEYMSRGDNVRYSLNKPILMLDSNERIIKEYPSINEAGRDNKITYQNIYKCCKKIRKTAGGYMWRYKYESN